MMVFKKIVVFLAAAAVFGCSTFVRIESNPSGARAYINDEPVGTTPVRTVLSDFIGSNYYLRLELEGYETLNTELGKEVKVDALVVGIILLWPILLWCYGPEDYHYYELRPLGGGKSASLIIDDENTVVYLDGRKLEKGLYSVSPGEHTFGFEMMNVRYNGRTVTFQPGYTYRLD